MARIHVQGTEVDIQSYPGETMLDALKRTGNAIRVGCRRGGCAICKVEVVEGTYEYTRPIADKVLTEEEIEKGTCLTCRAIPTSDMVEHRADGVAQRQHEQLGRVLAAPRLVERHLVVVQARPRLRERPLLTTAGDGDADRAADVDDVLLTVDPDHHERALRVPRVLQADVDADVVAEVRRVLRRGPRPPDRLAQHLVGYAEDRRELRHAVGVGIHTRTVPASAASRAG